MANPPKLPRVGPQQLRESRLLQGLDDAAIERLAQELPVQAATVGEMVVTEGDLAADMFLVVNGELEVLTSAGPDRDVRVALFGPGDWFGEMAILGVEPRSASVRAVAPSLLLRVSAADLRRLLHEHDIAQYTIVIMNVARELSRRLRVADGLIAQSSLQLAEDYVRRSQRPPQG
jgi:CRP-like cAMP-binding protein